jgi:S1-C subfamily serine protease
LFLEVGRLPPESVVRLGVTRDGRQRTFEATLVKYPVKGKPVVTQPAPAWRGIRVDYATMLIEMDVRTRIGMTVPDDAVVVVDVAEDSPAYKAGVRRGMLITHAAGTAVRTPKEFRTAVAGKTKDVVLRITGEGEKRVSP